MRREHIILGGASALSLAVGSVTGFFVAKKRLESRYSDIAQQEIAEAKQFYGALYKKEEYSTPESAMETLHRHHDTLAKDAVEALRDYQGVALIQDEKSEEVVSVVTNVFADSGDDNFNYEEEVTTRQPDKPYVISQEEFMQNDSSHEQVTVTYYQGDDVLSDERDKPIEDVDATVGELNLQRFGHGSKDHNIVYVRNERIGLDLEVVRSKGKYAQEVLGFVEHSDRRRGAYKIRGDDG